MKIPKIIWQTSKEPYDQLPDYLKIMSQTWKDMNPEWEYRYVTNHEAGLWIDEVYGSLYKKIYDYITVPFCKADFWRYLALKQFGGLYVDIDTVCLKPIETWIDEDSLMNVGIEEFPEFGMPTYTQWLIACTPGNKFMNRMIQNMRSLCLETMDRGIPISPDETGPGTWTHALNHFDDGKELNIIEVGGNVHHYVGNSSWSDMSGKTMESVIWGLDKHNVKLLNEGYNSIGKEIIWG